ncbi:MAG: hypothetical protein AB8B74_04305 [Crocinitomicaceae bacterium]
MASAFWTLEDGRGFSRRWAWMADILKHITKELECIEGAKEFYKYLSYFVIDEENGDEYNGHGGFIRGNENIMFDFDLRTFTPANRAYFWKASQNALRKLLLSQDKKYEGDIFLLTVLLDMHKRIKKGEAPEELNHYNTTIPESNEKHGPGW